jgi:DegV family protein with EDD domain
VIGFCTDSNAQLPDELVERYGVEVVPLTVRVDGVDHLEGVDLDADAFYARFEGGAKPEVSTAAPAPGAFAEAYGRLAARGCTEILSVHIGSAISGTCNSARLGAQLVDVPVRLVDTGEASFAIACSLWEAAEAVGRGATLEEAAVVAESVGATCGNVFVVGALDLARSGGRLAAGTEAAADALPVLSMVDGKIVPIGTARTDAEAADAMAAHVRAAAADGNVRLRVGISVADTAASPLREALEARLAGVTEVLELVRYRVGPSVGAHTGPGTAGAVYYPSR